MKITDKIKNKVKSSIEAPKKLEVNLNSDSENFFKEYLNLELLNELTQDKDLLKFLKEQSLELFKIQSKSVLLLGKVFNEVYEKLGKQGSLNGIYEKWLSINNISSRTALRYRKRYELFKIVDETKKERVALLAQKYIDFISSEDDKEKYIEVINKSESIKEIIEYVEEQKKVEVIHKNEEIEMCNDIFNYSPKYIKFEKDINNKIENLSAKDKKNLQKYLEKIDQILGK